MYFLENGNGDIGRGFSAEIITESCFWRALQTLIGGILRWNTVITSVNDYRYTRHMWTCVYDCAKLRGHATDVVAIQEL